MLSQGEKMVLVKALRSKMEKYGYVKSEGPIFQNHRGEIMAV